MIQELLEKQKLYCGRMCSAIKKAPQGQQVVWNANIVSPNGKEWFGDINLTKESDKIQVVADESGLELLVLRESDCRFNTEGRTFEYYKTVAVKIFTPRVS